MGGGAPGACAAAAAAQHQRHAGPHPGGHRPPGACQNHRRPVVSHTAAQSGAKLAKCSEETLMCRAHQQDAHRAGGA
eukprot:553752-Prorocentrum_minimum.AAC.3